MIRRPPTPSSTWIRDQAVDVRFVVPVTISCAALNATLDVSAARTRRRMIGSSCADMLVRGLRQIRRRPVLQDRLTGGRHVRDQMLLLGELGSQDTSIGGRQARSVVIAVDRRDRASFEQRRRARGQHPRGVGRIRLPALADQEDFLDVAFGERALARGDLDDVVRCCEPFVADTDSRIVVAEISANVTKIAMTGMRLAVAQRKGFIVFAPPNIIGPSARCACRPCSGPPCCRTGRSGPA